MLLTLEQFTQRLDSEINLINFDAVASIGARVGKVEEESQFESEPFDATASNKIVKWGGHSTVEREHYKLSEEQRVTIGSLGRCFPVKDVAELTGVSVDAVRDLRNGKKGSSGFDKNLNDAIDKATLAKTKTIQDVAMDKLLHTLGFITDEKLEKAEAREVAGVAANLSKVYSNLQPKETNNNGGNHVQVVLFQPKPLSEKHFDVQEV